MGGYETHYPILAAAVSRTAGPVLELGSGEWSTVPLHYMCHNRYLLTADNNSEWIERYREYATASHEIVYVPDWDNFKELNSRSWDVSFLDFAPGEKRHELAIKLSKLSKFVICHDSETDHGSGGNYSYDKCKPHFKFVSEFKRFRPYTLIMSNYEKFDIAKCDIEWRKNE